MAKVLWEPLMSNLGLGTSLGYDMKIPFRRTPVGDRYVMQELKDSTMVLWVESPLGHVICLDKTTTGDGIISAIAGLSGDARNGQEFA